MLPKHTAQMFSMTDLFQNCISIGGVLPISGLFSDLHLFSPAELFRITPGLVAMVTTGLHPVRMKCTRSSLRIQFLLVPLESTVSPTLDSWTCLWCGCVGQRHLFFPRGIFWIFHVTPAGVLSRAVLPAPKCMQNCLQHNKYICACTYV